MKKSIDLESSLLLTNKFQYSTIDSSQIVDMNSSIITKNQEKLNISRLDNIIEDSLNNEILIQNAKNHVEKIIITKRQIDDTRILTKEARQQRLEYKEEINAQEYEALKQLGNVLYEFTVAYSEKRKRLAEEYNKQQYEYVNLEQQLKRENHELHDIYFEIDICLRRLEVIQHILGLYNPIKNDLLQQIKNE